MSMLRKLWWGAYPLPQAFWVFYIIGFFAALAVMAAILMISYRLQIGTIGFIVGFMVLWSYWAAASVGVWRSARAYIASPIWTTKAWGVAARAVILVFALRALLSLANGGAMALMARMTARMDF